ncbi:MAG TPA: hypothetical protein VF132_09425 [Rudaea sp.]
MRLQLDSSFRWNEEQKLWEREAREGAAKTFLIREAVQRSCRTATQVPGISIASTRAERTRQLLCEAPLQEFCFEGVSWLLLCTSKEVTRSPKGSGSSSVTHRMRRVQTKHRARAKSLDSRFRGNDEGPRRCGANSKKLDSSFRWNDELKARAKT